MRQGQQNRRGRGRGRKQQNPLARNYESNGPDVKIRGTASHIADKYGTMARDALSAGDPISAENLFQHAEHYNRIIMAAQANQTSVQPATSDSLNGADSNVKPANGADDLSSNASQGQEKTLDSSNKTAPGSEPGRRRGRRRSSANGHAKPNADAVASDAVLEKSENGAGPDNQNKPSPKKSDKSESKPSNESGEAEGKKDDLNPEVPTV